MSLAGDEDFAQALLEQTTKLVGNAVVGLKADLLAQKKAIDCLHKEVIDLRKENDILKKRVSSLEKDRDNRTTCSCTAKIKEAFSTVITQMEMDNTAEVILSPPPCVLPSNLSLSRKRKSAPVTVTKPT